MPETEYRTFDGGSVELTDGRNISGYAYRWGELSRSGTAQSGGLREGFERGAFADAIKERGGRNWPHLDTHYDRAGAALAVSNSPKMRLDCATKGGCSITTPRARTRKRSLTAVPMRYR